MPSANKASFLTLEKSILLKAALDTLNNSQNHRLHFIIIHEKAGNCNHRVDAKAERKHALARVVFVNNGRNKVRSPGVGAPQVPAA